jgi:hypothetical protein
MIESDTPDEGQLGQQINSRRQGLVDPIDHVSAFRSRNIISPDRLINLPPGMAVTVEMRRIIDDLLSPLLRFKHESYSCSVGRVRALADPVILRVADASAKIRTQNPWSSLIRQ